MKSLNIDELVEFSVENPWKTPYTESLIRRFFSQLISSPELVFDFHDTKGRVALAVLIDKVHNPSNEACLEILGMRPDADALHYFFHFISLAKDLTPAYRNGFQVEKYMDREVLESMGLVHHYDTFTMKRFSAELKNIERPEIVTAEEGDSALIYEILCLAFAHNLDTSIPEESIWHANFLKSPYSHFYIWKSEGKILGFANLIFEQGLTAEIRTIGVLPGAQGKGIGKALMERCLIEAQRMGSKECLLTVAVKNRNALDLYFKEDFKILEHSECFHFLKQKAEG